jgi:hypothetical protein
MAKVLHGELPRPEFPDLLATTAPRWWFRIAEMALLHADMHARRSDVAATCANVTQAALATAQGRLAAQKQWALNEKGILDRAGLDTFANLLIANVGTPTQLAREARAALDLPASARVPRP